jgi:hypothetical protein
MACINPNDPKFKEILARVGNPLLAEIEFEKLTTEEIKPGVQESYEISYKNLLNLKPSTEITEEDWDNLTPEEQNELIQQTKNC